MNILDIAVLLEIVRNQAMAEGLPITIAFIFKYVLQVF